VVWAKPLPLLHPDGGHDFTGLLGIIAEPRPD
jgi:hypothetical protein